MNDIELITDSKLIDEIVKRAEEHQKQKEKEFAIFELEEVKEEIGLYYSDCLLSISDNDNDCKICNKNVFESILRKIDNHVAELKGEKEND